VAPAATGVDSSAHQALMVPDRIPPRESARGRDRKEIDMAKKAKNGNAKKVEATKPPRKKIGEVALVLRVPKEAAEYIAKHAGDRPRTAFVRDLLGKADGTLGRMLRGE
jgi:hypothetical protein